MENLKNKLKTSDRKTVTESMNEKSYALILKILTKKRCTELIQTYNNENLYRKTVVMERYRFGLDKYKYFDYPFPQIIQTIREAVHQQLAPRAQSKAIVLKPKKDDMLIFTTDFRPIKGKRGYYRQI